MYECNKIKEKYFNGSSYLEAINVTKANTALNILKNIQQYGNNTMGPDLISRIGNKVYGIEHFEFDSTKKNKKGSKYRKQIGEIDTIINEEIKDKDKVHKVSTLSLNQNIQNYLENYKEVYNYHYSRIPYYLKNLNKDFPYIDKEIWFFIEDVTPFGNHYLDENQKPVLYTPMLSQELIELFEQSTQLNSIVFATSSYGNANKLFVYSNTDNEILKLKEICKKESVNSLLIQNPLCSSTMIKFNNDECKESIKQ